MRQLLSFSFFFGSFLFFFALLQRKKK